MCASSDASFESGIGVISEMTALLADDDFSAGIAPDAAHDFRLRVCQSGMTSATKVANLDVVHFQSIRGH